MRSILESPVSSDAKVDCSQSIQLFAEERTLVRALHLHVGRQAGRQAGVCVREWPKGTRHAQRPEKTTWANLFAPALAFAQGRYLGKHNQRCKYSSPVPRPRLPPPLPLLPNLARSQNITTHYVSPCSLAYINVSLLQRLEEAEEPCRLSDPRELDAERLHLDEQVLESSKHMQTGAGPAQNTASTAQRTTQWRAATR